MSKNPWPTPRTGPGIPETKRKIKGEDVWRPVTPGYLEKFKEMKDSEGKPPEYEDAPITALEAREFSRKAHAGHRAVRKAPSIVLPHVIKHLEKGRR